MEVLNCQFTLTDLSSTFLCNKRRALSPQYAAAELLWYLSRSQSAALVRKYAPQYKNFVQPGTDLVHGAYGHRIAKNATRDQLWEVVNHLRLDSESRRCVVALWHPEDLVTINDCEIKDVPCTLTWQFIVRNKQLHMTANMRSNDAWLGLPYDAFVNTCIQRMIADELDLDYGTYTHSVVSMHLYNKNIAAARVAAYEEPVPTYLHNWSYPTPLRCTDSLFSNGEPRAPENLALAIPRGSMGYDIINCLHRHAPDSYNLLQGARIYNDHH